MNQEMKDALKKIVHGGILYAEQKTKNPIIKMIESTFAPGVEVLIDQYIDTLSDNALPVPSLPTAG